MRVSIPETPDGARIVVRTLRVDTNDRLVVREAVIVARVSAPAPVNVTIPETPDGSAAVSCVDTNERVGFKSDKVLLFVLRLRGLEAVVRLELGRAVIGPANTSSRVSTGRVPDEPVKVSRPLEVIRAVFRDVLRALDCDTSVNLPGESVRDTLAVLPFERNVLVMRIVPLRGTVLSPVTPSPPMVRIPETAEGFMMDACKDSSERSEIKCLDVDTGGLEDPGRGRLSLLVVVVVRGRDRVPLRVREPDLVRLLAIVMPTDCAVVMDKVPLSEGSGGGIGIPMTLVMTTERLVLSGPGGVASLRIGELSDRVDIEGNSNEEAVEG